MDSKGTLIVHPKKPLVGKNTITDLKVTAFQSILDHKRADTPQLLNYSFEGRGKFLAYQAFPAWDWIIGASGYWDDMSRETATNTRARLGEEAVSFHHIATLRGKPIYSQIRYLNANGDEVVLVKNGQIETNLSSRAGADWFRQAKQLPSGQVAYTRAEIAQNTGEPELRVSTPVYVGSEVQGVVVLNVDWRLTADLLAAFVYGKTGYPYILNDFTGIP